MGEQETAHRAVAIVGVGAVLPDASDAAAFWDNVQTGRYSISEVPREHWDPELYYDPDPKAPDKSYTKIGGWVRQWEWEPLKWHLPIPPRVSAAMDRTQTWAVVGARQALEDYGYPRRPLDPERTAVILGNSMAGDRHYFSALRILFPEVARELEEAPSFAALPAEVRRAVVEETRRGIGRRLPVINEDTMPGELSNIVAGRVAALFDFRGPNFVTDAACASAMAALSAAIEGLTEGDYDAVLTGGIDANMSASTFVKFCKIGALSATGTRPYAEGADGFVMGEGAAVFLLKRLADAEGDGDRVYAVIRGLGGASDGRGKGITAPNPVGQRLAVERAWARAGLSPATAGLIEGHGTSTRVGDVVEMEALAEAFAPYGLVPGSIPIGSVKSNIGHLKGGAGAAGILKAALALHHKLLPPSLNFHRPNPEIDFASSPFFVNTELRPWENGTGPPRRVGVSAFGFGGTNFHAVLEEHLPGRLTAAALPPGRRQAPPLHPSEETEPAGSQSPGFVEPGDGEDPTQGKGGARLRPRGVESGDGEDPTQGRGGARLRPGWGKRPGGWLGDKPGGWEGDQPGGGLGDQPGGWEGDPGGGRSRPPFRGALVLGAATGPELADRLRQARAEAAAGRAPAPAPPAPAALRAPERLAIDFADACDLARKAERAVKAFEAGPRLWRVLRSQGIYRRSGPAPKVAFLYTGQGSQYLNMLRDLRQVEPIVAETLEEADLVMLPILGKPLTEYLFVDESDGEAVARAEAELRQTAITQPAVLAMDVALTRLLAAFGVTPDMVMGHSLGEYGALVAAGALPFAEALEAVSARGREMTRLSVGDNGRMAAVQAPIAEVEDVLARVDGYVVVANVNSRRQSVIGGASVAVEEAVARCREAGFEVKPLAVSHAFHTEIVAPASEPLRRMLGRLHLTPPALPTVSNVTGGFYPTGAGALPEVVELLARQIASPVQFVQGLETLYAAGARVFIEVGPKRALQGFADSVFEGDEEVLALFTNHPRIGGPASFNQALCGLWASGLGAARAEPPRPRVEIARADLSRPREETMPYEITAWQPAATATDTAAGDRYSELGRMFADFLDRALTVHGGDGRATRAVREAPGMVISGAGLGLPGAERIFDDEHVARILRGETLIDAVPMRFRREMVEKNIVRLVKTGGGDARFETIASPAEVIKLAARGGDLDLVAEFGYPADRLGALDRVTQLAIGAGLEALRDAGIPLVMRYRTTTKGTQLPDRWGLPDAMRDDTGVIFASAFPGYDAFADEMERFHEDRARRRRLADLQAVRAHLSSPGATRRSAGDPAVAEVERRIHELEAALAREPYAFDRRFLFKVLSMGHSQFAELIGARGPNAALNAACASGTQTLSLAEDWIRAGRCRRVVIITADDITSERLMGWFGAGFLASGAAATDEVVEEAAIPFDRRRHGLIVGMGAAALVVESREAARERGIAPICQVLATAVANSAYHGSRLDVGHICDVMEGMVAGAETRWGLDRHAIAPRTVFVSHETYTPARGGSAQAEVDALRRVFGPSADRIVLANTKGYTGHPMGVGIEDVVGVKMLETGVIPPVANFKQEDPDLGPLNLSRGGAYPVEYALRLGAGFGSQISLSLLRWVPPPDGLHREPSRLGYDYRIADREAWRGWLARVSGRPDAELEVVQRTLRVQDGGLASLRSPARPAVTAPVSSPVAPAPVVPVPERVPAPVPEIRSASAATVAVAAPPAPVAVAAAAPVAAPVEAAVAVAPSIPEPPAPEPASGEDPVQARVLSIVSEKTGYPPEMLDLDLDLEADLGVDTVKQAETFAAIRQEWDIPRDESLQLRDYPTLGHAVEFVYQRRPDLRPGAAAAPEATPASATPAISAVPVPSGAPSAAVEPAPAPGEEPVQSRVLSIVSEKTGYPPEMLDLDLDLEADLGVDTVKQAETFAAIRREWDIPRDESLQLRDYPTLGHAVEFVYQRRPDLRPGAAPAAAATPAVSAAPAPAETTAPAEPATPTRTRPPGDLEAAAGVPRRLPVPLLRPPLELCRPTGVLLDAGRRVVVALDAGTRGVGRALVSRLERRGVEVLALEDTSDLEGVAARLGEWAATGPVHGLYWLPALEPEPEVGAMEPEEWRQAVRARVKGLYTALRSLGEAIGEPGTFLVSATRLGGLHGYDEDGAVAPLGGAVTGFTKALKRERPDALVKAVDFAPSRKSAALADLLIAETLADPGTVEVGYRDGERWAVGVEERPLEERPQAEGPLEEGAVEEGIGGLELGPETVFVITGAAGSIVSAITADLAAASGGIFHLLDLTPEPDLADPDLARFAGDREGLKIELFERIKARGERATPARVEQELARLERLEAARAAITAVEEAGGTACYHPVNLLDSEAVAAVVGEIRRRHGRVDVLIHAAGLEVSHFLPDKAPEEFDRVFDVKADGWYHLMRALGDAPLGATVVFSSVAGRFGNAGQCDYSAANDLLCKLTSSLRSRRPETRALAVDWTAWGGIGMATRGSIPQMLAAAGIDLLEPEAGIPIVRRELTAGTRGEVVIGRGLGVLTGELDATGGLDPEALESRLRGPMSGRVLAMGVHTGLVLETALDPAAQPFLHDHQIDGTPVLPGVMGLEAFAEAAQVLFPDHRVAALEDVAFLAPFKFYRGEPRPVTLEARFRREGDEVVADCRLTGSRLLPGREEPQVTTHFTARVRLALEGAGEEEVAEVPPEEVPAVGREEVYRLYFHGPAYQVLERAWRHGGELVGRMPGALPANHRPEEAPTALDPRLIELCFQTAGLLEMGRTGRLGLPQGIVRLVPWRRPQRADGPLMAVVEPDGAGDAFNARVVDGRGRVYLTLEGYRTVELPGAVDRQGLEALAALSP